MSVPVILLTFANNQGDYLENLVRERKAISAALSEYEDQRYIRVHVEPDAGIADLFDLFNRFPDQVAILHYGGHASGTALQLVAADGTNETAHADGLAQRMGLSKALQLVFLNGCATRDQVRALLDHGVKAVIATSVPINDDMATGFAEQFYEALGSGKSLGESFECARAFIVSRHGDQRPVEQFRAMHWGAETPGVEAGLVWGLYTGADAEGALDWVLPRQGDHQVIIRGAALTQAAGVAVNEGLIQTLFNAVAPHSMEVGLLFEMAKRSGRTDLRTVRQQIIDAFPSPVGEQLRKLFASNLVDAGRLRQLVVTYEAVTKLFAFAHLSQLWNLIVDRPGLVIADEQWTRLEAFAALDAPGEALFDYLDLVLGVNAILSANGVTPFMAESATLAATLDAGEGLTARRFMNEMRADLADGEVPADEVESFCVQAEQHLGVVLSQLAFLVRYKLATIKGIAISKSRHKPPEFRHRQVLLDRVTAGFVDVDEVRTAFTDNESVILLKDLDDVTDYLNLTPFLIDQNALTGNENTKLYTLAFHDAAADETHFVSIADATDQLVIGDAMEDKVKPIYLPIRELIHEYRERVRRS
jgi:hypothetical protein